MYYIVLSISVSLSISIYIYIYIYIHGCLNIEGLEIATNNVPGLAECAHETGGPGAAGDGCVWTEKQRWTAHHYIHIYIYTHTSSLLTIIVFSSVSPCPWVFLILGKPNHHWREISPLKLPTESVEKHHAWHCCRVSGSCYRHIPSSNNTFPLNKYNFIMNMLLFLFHAKVGKFSKLAHLVVSGSTCFFCARSINKAPLMPNWWSWMPMSSAPPGEDCGPPDGSMPVEPSRAILGVSWHHIWSKKRGILWMGQKQRVFHSCFFSKDQIRVSSLEHLWLWHLKKLHIPIKAEVINEIRRSMRMVVYPARMEI